MDKPEIISAAPHALILHHLNVVMREISEKLLLPFGLSPRSMNALAILESRGSAMTNQDLRSAFIKLKISSEASAAKDASITKSELLAKGYVNMHGRRAFIINQAGRDAVARMDSMVDDLINECTYLEEAERQALCRFSTLDCYTAK